MSDSVFPWMRFTPPPPPRPIPPPPSQAKPENAKSVPSSTKLALGLIPPSFELQVALALHSGARKYGAWDWRKSEPIDAATYLSAIRRHLLLWTAGEDIASDSGVSHLGHIAASCAVLLDAIAAGNFKDDRPKLKSVDLDALRTALETLPDNWPIATHSVR